MDNFASKLNDLSLAHGEAAVFWAGQAGVIIKTSDFLIGADIYLSDDCAAGGGYRKVPPIFEPGDIRFDALFVTHFHRDHFDASSMPKLAAYKGTAVYTARDCVDKNREAGLEGRSIYLDKGKSYPVCNGLTVHVLDCDHGDQTLDAVGLVFELPCGSVYMAGDTMLRPGIASSAAEFSPTVMFVPINGDYGNMTESEAADYAAVVKPALTVPCHYGTLATNHGDPELFKREMDRVGLEALVLCPGEGVVLSGGSVKLI